MPFFTMPKITISRKTKIIIGILITVLGLSAIVFVLVSAWNSMYQGNGRFLMTRLNVSSADGAGWWHGKDQEVLRQLEAANVVPESGKPIEEGTTNLFEMDLSRIRTALEDVPEIERVKVRRILPNTLDISIVERIPAAAIGNFRSFRLVDLNGIVLRRSRCLKIPGLLPVITGYKTKPAYPGDKFEEIQDALEFIRLSKTAYGELRIVLVNVAARDYLVMRLTFKENAFDYYDVWVPRKNPELGMDRILTSIYEIKKLGVNRRNIDLRFEKQTILRAPAPAKGRR